MNLSRTSIFLEKSLGWNLIKFNSYFLDLIGEKDIKGVWDFIFGDVDM